MERKRKGIVLARAKGMAWIANRSNNLDFRQRYTREAQTGPNIASLYATASRAHHSDQHYEGQEVRGDNSRCLPFLTSADSSSCTYSTLTQEDTMASEAARGMVADSVTALRQRAEDIRKSIDDLCALEFNITK